MAWFIPLTIEAAPPIPLLTNGDENLNKKSLETRQIIQESPIYFIPELKLTEDEAINIVNIILSNISQEQTINWLKK